MHFSIPESQEVKGNDSSYLVYNVHINGNFHCSLRYRQILGLHEQLKKEFGPGSLPPFPPKKFLSLTSTQLEDRRSNLEKYIQNASQNHEVGTSELFNGFLRLAQHETSGEPVAKRTIDVHLPNGQKLNVDVWNNSSTSVLLKIVAHELILSDDLVDHFGLYIFRKDFDGTWIVLRKLDEYESPYISLRRLKEDHRIVLRKCSWDLSSEDVLIEDMVGLHLTYLQTVADIENGWTCVPKEALRQITSLQSQGNKQDYLRLARRLKFYGYMKFPNCLCDFPQPLSLCTIYIGNRDMIIITSKKEEYTFKVTRMKTWRITLQYEPTGRAKAELSFEYLQSKDKLDWITLTSEQAIVMSVCLQEMVAEMVSKQQPSVPSLIGLKSVRTVYYFIRGDGEQVAINEDILVGSSGYSNGSSGNASPTSSTSGVISNGSGCPTPSSSLSRNNSCEASNFKRRPSLNSLRCQNSNDNLFLENSVFAGIGDDDL